MKLHGDPDATIIVRPRQQHWGMVVFAACVLLAAAAVFFWPASPLPVADEAAILAARPTGLTVFRFALAPGILVADFPSMHAQARALNRAAIFLELAGAPRDRVPDDAAVAAAVAGAKLDYDRFYYGHDYRAADLHRMWTMAAAEGVALLPEEQALRAILEKAEAGAGGFGAVISLPPAGDGLQDAAGRAAILRHELSHGLYFTDAAYAAAVHAFWVGGLSAAQRAGFRRFLAGEMYDSSNEGLMENEVQAYLVNTPDKRFFRAGDAGLGAAEAARLKGAFWAAEPRTWLRAAHGPD